MCTAITAFDRELIRRAGLHRNVDYLKGASGAVKITREGNSAGYYIFFEYSDVHKSSWDVDIIFTAPERGGIHRQAYSAIIHCDACHVLSIEVSGMPDAVPDEFVEFDIISVKDLGARDQ